MSNTFDLQANRTTYADVRRPTEQEWEKWALMPQLQLWKAVALLCEIEPSSLPPEGLWRPAPAGSAVSSFNARFEVAVEHQLNGSLLCAARPGGFRSTLVVRVADFSRWAIGLGWTMPRELQATWVGPDSSDSPADTGNRAGGPWPWGAHETELLRWLAAAAQRFWVNYNPADHTTAVNSDVVAAWLRQQKTADGKPIAKRVAEAMAQLLRANGLPTGPRRK
ncbi:hypothetical protein [Paucibacter sp. M5-1]|uniref:hypothetical protein n=1 Tax=Paucibacter sp. M5-1 TaxID=3015998 RepID=UPI003F7F1383